MPRTACPKCKLSFTIKDGSRKTVECPECGARFVPGEPPQPSKSSRREPEREPAKKKGGLPIVLVLGGVFFLLILCGGGGAAGWYFGIKRPADKKKEAEVVQNNTTTAPVENEKPVKTNGKKLTVGQSPELADPDIYPKLLPATVFIRFEFTKRETRDGKPVIVQYQSFGSGVLVCRDPNLVLTNAHVVKDRPTVEVYFPELKPNGQPEVDMDLYIFEKARLGHTGRVLSKDLRRDTALVMLERVPDNAQPVPLAGESARRLEKVFGIGNSGGKRGALWRGNSGDVRNIEEKNPWTKEPCRFLTTQQPINHGDSGGPIVNRRLELVAITQSGEIKELEGGPGKPTDIVGDDAVSYNVDVSELRDFVSRVYRQEFGGEFPTIHPLVDPGAAATPANENLDVPDYIQILRDGEASQARVAVSRLVNCGARSVGPLKDVLEDPKASGRWPLAIEALEKIGDPAVEAMPTVVARLKSDDPASRVAAAKYLAAMGHPSRKYVPDLMIAGGVNNPQVRSACEKAVIKLGPYAVSDLNMILGTGTDKDEYLRAFRAKLLVEVELSQAEMVKKMEAFFKDDSSIVRAEAVRAVCKPGKFPRDDMHRLVIPLLADKDFIVRAAAYENLLNVGRVELGDLDVFKPFFASESLFVHRYLLARVGLLKDKAAPIIPELSKSLNFPDDEIKFDAIQTVLGIGRDMKVLTKDFIKLTTHDNPLFRVRAMMCLRTIGKDEPGIIPAMFERLSDVAEVTSPPKDMSQLVNTLLKERKSTLKTYTDLPPVNEEAPPVWFYADRFLYEMRPYKTEKQVKEIQPYLTRDEKRSGSVQLHAAEYIAEAGPGAFVALDDLLKALGDPKVTQSDIRVALCRGIANSGPEASRGAKLLATFAVLNLVEDKAKPANDPGAQANRNVRFAALRAIGVMGAGAKDALPALIKLADSSTDELTADETIKAIGNVGSPAAVAVPNMMELFATARPAQRELILDAMKKIGPDAYPPIIEFLPAFEKNWRENSGPYKDQIVKAKGCVECVIALGAEGLKPEQKAKLIDALKSLRARAVIKLERELQARTAEALTKLEAPKK